MFKLRFKYQIKPRMKKVIIIIVSFFLLSTSAFSQKGFICDMRNVDTLLTPVEKCIVECIRQSHLEKYLGHKNISFFDSVLNCSYKKVKLWAERRDAYYTSIIFQFTDNLQMRLFPKELMYGSKMIYNEKNNFDPKLANLEIPFSIVLVHGIDYFCELGKLPSLNDKKVKE